MQGYPPFVNTLIHLVPPDDYAVVINIETANIIVDCMYDGRSSDHVTLQTPDNVTMFQVCSLSNYGHSDPVVYPGDVKVQYISYKGSSVADFKILFSFHKISALPVRVADGRWNCSAVHWPDMLQHLPCNFQSDCVGGEDEAGCWRGDGTCSQGNFQADNRCFLIARAEHEQTSWNLASDWCQQRGARLSSLSTRKVWDTVLDLFFRIGDGFTIPIGVRLSPPTVPHLYV